MNSETLIRFLVTLAVAGSGVLLYLLYSRLTLRRAGAQVRKLRDLQDGYPAILYFTTPTCIPCKTTQRPVIESLKQQLGDTLQVLEIDAAIRPELADSWGVLSVPTTFVIDSRGRPRHVNHGVATSEKLLHQLMEIKE